MITSLQDTTRVGTGKRDRHGVEKVKPKGIHQYNKYMGGVDRNDMLLGFYSSCRKSLKWYKKIAIHCMELALLNAYALMKHHNPKYRLLCFHLDVIHSLLICANVGVNQVLPLPNRLEGRHFPAEIPPTGTKQNPTRKCLFYKDSKLEFMVTALRNVLDLLQVLCTASKVICISLNFMRNLFYAIHIEIYAR